MEGTGNLPESEEAKIESEIAETRIAKHMAQAEHDVAKLRQKAAENRAEAASYFGKYRKEEALVIRYQMAASKARRKAEAYLEKSKIRESRAAEIDAQLGLFDGGKLERMRVKSAKHLQKAAKLKQKAAEQQAKAAKYDQKAVGRKSKAKEYLELSKVNVAEAKNYQKRAETYEKTVHL